MLIFDKQLSMSNMYFYICTDQAQINSADKNHLALGVFLAKIKLSDFWNWPTFSRLFWRSFWLELWIEQSAGLQILTNDLDPGQIRHIPETDPAQIRQSPENSPPAINQATSAEYNTLHLNAMDHTVQSCTVQSETSQHGATKWWFLYENFVLGHANSGFNEFTLSSLTKVLFQSRS